MEDLALSRDEAKQLQHAVREELMRRFLHAVPYPGEPNGHFEKFRGGLLEAGLDEIEDRRTSRTTSRTRRRSRRSG